MASKTPQGKSTRGAEGRGESPTAFISFSDGLKVFELGAKGYKALTGTKDASSVDTFQILILQSWPSVDITGKEVVRLLVKTRNTSPHGAYIEGITLEQRQEREGQPMKDAKFEVTRVETGINVSLGDRDEVRKATPVLLPEGSEAVFEFFIEQDPATWPAKDAWGVLNFKVSKLEEEVVQERRMRFKIRR